MPDKGEQTLSRTVTVEVKHSHGLHLRVSGEIVKISNRFKSRIAVAKEGSARKADCKMLLSLMSLAATAGTRLALTAEGEDASEALKALVDFFEHPQENA